MFNGCAPVKYAYGSVHASRLLGDCQGSLETLCGYARSVSMRRCKGCLLLQPGQEQCVKIIQQPILQLFVHANQQTLPRCSICTSGFWTWNSWVGSLSLPCSHIQLSPSNHPFLYRYFLSLWIIPFIKLQPRCYYFWRLNCEVSIFSCHFDSLSDDLPFVVTTRWLLEDSTLTSTSPLALH